MDSLSMYRQCRLKNSNVSSNATQRLKQIEEIVKIIYNELNHEPYNVKQSPFISETINIIGNIDKDYKSGWVSRQIIIIDAFVIVSGVRRILKDEDYSLQNDRTFYDYAKLLFKDGKYNSENKVRDVIQNELNLIRDFLEKLTPKPQETIEPPKPAPIEYSKPAQVEKINYSQPVPPQINSSTQINSSRFNSPAPAVQIPIVNQAPLEVSTLPVNNPLQNVVPPRSIGQLPFPSPLAPVTPNQFTTPAESYNNLSPEVQKYIAAAEADRTKRTKIRIDNNRASIRGWYQRQDNAVKHLMEMQPKIQELLNDFSSISNALFENYIRQFANGQIELFNLILSNYEYHKDIAEQSQNKDHLNAVENYKDYMEIIIDQLAIFGVEEIKSSAGTPFDGKIHEVVNTKSFSPRNSLIKKSVRSGFMYKETMLQREKVEI